MGLFSISDITKSFPGVKAVDQASLAFRPGEIQNGLIDIKANPYFANSFLGGLILLAIVLDRVREIVSSKRNPGEDSNRGTVAANANRPPGKVAAPLEETHRSEDVPKENYQ